MRLLVTVCLLATLVACAGSNPFAMPPDSYVANGTSIRLNAPVTVPRNSVAVPIRGGHIGSRYRYDGTCRLELKTLGKEPRVVEPDEFTVERTTWATEYFGGLDPRNMYAASMITDGPSLLTYKTYIYLQSARQPDVFRLQCQHLQQSDGRPRYLTMAEIQVLLGDVMTVGR